MERIRELSGLDPETVSSLLATGTEGEPLLDPAVESARRSQLIPSLESLGPIVQELLSHENTLLAARYPADCARLLARWTLRAHPECEVLEEAAYWTRSYLDLLRERAEREISERTRAFLRRFLPPNGLPADPDEIVRTEFLTVPEAVADTAARGNPEALYDAVAEGGTAALNASWV